MYIYIYIDFVPYIYIYIYVYELFVHMTKIYTYILRRAAK